MQKAYFKLSSFYWFYFSALGAFIPYWGLYLKSLNFSASEIGELIAIIMATKIIAPNLWGWLSDRSGKRLSLIRIGALMSCLFFSGIFLNNHYWWIFLILLSYSFFWNAILPLFEALTLTYLGNDHHQYSYIRVWGSIGFVVTVFVLGLFFSRFSIEYLPWFNLLLLFGIFISTVFVREKPIVHHEHHSRLRDLIKSSEVIVLLLACLLVQMSHGPYYAFFSIFASEHQYSNTTIGLLWSLGVIAEVVIFLLMPRLILRFGLKKLLLFSLISGSLRWLVIAFFIDYPWIITINQLFHASTFGIYHIVVISLIHHYFKGKNQGMGQALYSSVSFGIGGALGSLISGYLWNSMGPELTYVFASIISLIAFMLSLMFIKYYPT
ncbi:MAG: MFS transporter [Gammaproteobacteria bacterium]|nr:MFS transporter [Gammaproteobacteria bacterium]